MENRFATLKLLDEDPNLKSRETLNCSEFLTANQIYARRSCLFENQSNLVRQYSCEQILYNDYNTRRLDGPTVYNDDDSYDQTKCQPIEFDSDFPKSCSWQFSKSSCILQAPKFVPNVTSDKKQYDVVENIKDETESKSSFESLSTNIYEEGGNEKVLHKDTLENIGARKVAKNGTYEEMKKKYRPLVMKKQHFMMKKANTCPYICITLCIVPVATVIFSLLINSSTYTDCDRAAMFSNVKLQLQQKIYGQQNAVSSIITHLEQVSFYLKVLCIIGGTGVGKSYSVEAIRRNFPVERKILLYDVTLDHPIDSKTLNSLDSYDLFIIENLKMKHLDMFANIIDGIPKVHKCLTVIAVFNVGDVSAGLERSVDLVKSKDIILNVMAGRKLDFLIVPYGPLNDESLELCITQAASHSGLKPTKEQINEIKQALISSGTGCKGAYAKLQVTDKS